MLVPGNQHHGENNTTTPPRLGAEQNETNREGRRRKNDEARNFRKIERLAESREWDLEAYAPELDVQTCEPDRVACLVLFYDSGHSNPAASPPPLSHWTFRLLVVPPSRRHVAHPRNPL